MTQTIQRRIEAAVKTALTTLVTEEHIADLSTTDYVWDTAKSGGADDLWHVVLWFSAIEETPACGRMDVKLTANIEAIKSYSSDPDDTDDDDKHDEKDQIIQLIRGIFLDDIDPDYGQCWGGLAYQTLMSKPIGAAEFQANYTSVAMEFSIHFGVDGRDPTISRNA